MPRATVVTIQTPRSSATVAAEIAQTGAELAQGLMHRPYLPLNAGMLFVMPREDVWPFYMRNTQILLDMIFIARDLTVAGIIHNAIPFSEILYRIDAPSSYVLEVNGGWAARHQIPIGGWVHLGEPRNY